MVSIKKIEKTFNKEIHNIENKAIKEVVKVGALIGVTMLSATAVVSLLAKDETKGVKTEDYKFKCYGLSATNNGKGVIVTLDETKQLGDILNDYHWISSNSLNNGNVVISNGKETISYNSDTGVFVNEDRKAVLTLSEDHKNIVNKFFED